MGDVVVCSACGDECTVIEVDFGVGRYEFWGASGVDVRRELVSRCCEAPFEEVVPVEG